MIGKLAAQVDFFIDFGQEVHFVIDPDTSVQVDISGIKLNRLVGRWIVEQLLGRHRGIAFNIQPVQHEIGTEWYHYVPSGIVHKFWPAVGTDA